MTAVTQEQTKAAFDILAAVAEAIREARRIPSGTLYAILMGKMDFAGYQRMVGILKGAGLVKEENHELIWIGHVTAVRV